MRKRAAVAAPLAVLIVALFIPPAFAIWQGPVLITDELPPCSSLLMADFLGVGRGSYLYASETTGTLHVLHANDQGVFTTRTLGTGLDGVSVAMPADMDGDEAEDILVAEAGGGIFWYTIDYDTGTLTDPIMVAGVTGPISDLAQADFDGDGDMDVVAAEPDSGRVLLFRQQLNGNFVRSTVASNLPDVSDVTVGAANQDTNLDFVAVSPSEGRVTVFMSDGDGTFTPAVLATNNVGTNKAFIFNIDADSDRDIVTLRPDRITVFRRNTDGWMVPVETVGPITGANDMALRDVNDDGMPEIYVSDPELGGIVQFNYIGEGQYAVESVDLNTDNITHLTMGNSLGLDTPEIGVAVDTGELLMFSALPPVTFDGEDLGDFVSAPTALVDTDVDLDGDLDFLSTSRYDDEVVWWVNDGEGGFDETITVMAIPNPSRAVVGDLDNDGDNDILATSDQIAAVGISVQDSLGGFESYQLADVSAAKGIDIGDLNGDALPDFAVSGYDHIHVFINQGGLNFQHNTLPGNPNAPSDLEIADMDLDGDNDIVYVAFNDNQVLMEENTGGNFTHHVLGTVPDSHWMDIGDVNGDGYLDVLATSNNSGEVYWLENPGVAGAFTVHLVAEEIYGADQSVVADLDGDGDSDIAAGAFWGEEVHWWENNGFQVWTHHSLITGYEQPSGLIAGDFDGNGPLDMISASFAGDGVIFWHSSAADLQMVLTLTPFSPPIDIPPFGDTFFYHAEVVNNSVLPFDGQAFIQVEFPGGYVHDVNNVPITVGPFGTLSWQYLSQYVPGDVAPGTYTFTVKLGDDPDAPLAEDSFPFTKAGWTTGGMDNWTISGWDGSGVHPFTGTPQVAGTESSSPEEFRMGEAWPNPFNSTTALTVTLPEAAPLTITVHNTLGQQVATLASGQQTAGEHTFALQADQLASGVYFIRAELAGHPAQTRKLLLVR